MQDQKLLSQASEKLEQYLNQILQLPFYRELSDGSLPKNNFLSCLYQDQVYLKSFSFFLGKMTAICSSNLLSDFLNLYKNTNEYVKYLEYSLKERTNKDEEASPNTATAQYIDHLNSVSETKSIPLMLSAIIPCFWIFREIGSISFSNTTAQHPYYQWIVTYTDKTFSATTDGLIEILNELQKDLPLTTQNEMLDIFLKSTEHELLFWQECYYPSELDILL